MVVSSMFLSLSLDLYIYLLVLLESGLQPAIDRELEVGEVLVVPRQFYNRTKYIRSTKYKIKHVFNKPFKITKLLGGLYVHTIPD